MQQIVVGDWFEETPDEVREGYGIFTKDNKLLTQVYPSESVAKSVLGRGGEIGQNVQPVKQLLYNADGRTLTVKKSKRKTEGE